MFPVNFSSSTIFNGLLMNESDAGKPVRHIGRVTCGLLLYLYIIYILYYFPCLDISNNCASENQFVLIVLLWWWRPFRCALLHHCIYTVITCKLHLVCGLVDLVDLIWRFKVKGWSWKLSDFIPFLVFSNYLQLPRSCNVLPSAFAFSQSSFFLYTDWLRIKIWKNNLSQKWTI